VAGHVLAEQIGPGETAEHRPLVGGDTENADATTRHAAPPLIAMMTSDSPAGNEAAKASSTSPRHRRPLMVFPAFAGDRRSHAAPRVAWPCTPRSRPTGGGTRDSISGSRSAWSLGAARSRSVGGAPRVVVRVLPSSALRPRISCAANYTDPALNN